MVTTASNALAIPLSLYRERVHKSFIALDSLQTVGEDTDEGSVEEIVAQKLFEVRSLLPPNETIDSVSPTLQVDNVWLEEALTELGELSDNKEERKALLTKTTEKLVALETALAELETNGSAGTAVGTRDEAKARLADILRRDEFAKKSAEGNALTRLWRRFTNWFRSIFPKGPEIEPGRATMVSRLAQILVIGLALAIIGFVVWKLWPRIWKSNVKSKKKQKREARIVLGERLESDQTSADLLADAELLARDGNVRGAIRKCYIALLCELGDRKILGLAGHKTNRDYLHSIRNRQQLHREMQLMTLSFENHWYGFAPAEINDWDLFRSSYHQALKQGE